MLYSMFSPFLTQRTKSKFVISKEENATETLYKLFIKPENVPIQYDGLGRPNELEDGPPKPASEFNGGGEKVNLEIDGIECGATITWDIVVGRMESGI
ncbi:hypothetical protein IFM89_002327 [Coptis chinensis]|uniref:Uncharacterized protein n=1 Tax=Coptis chinensis TaxID=261450 RepID=A0A835ILU6_9MAGN|nr:hypothetical protein IFM89_002327 [Coptis chinensis]